MPTARDVWHNIASKRTSEETTSEEISVTISLISPPACAAQPGLSRTDRLRLRRELAERDRQSALLAELAGIRALLATASTLVTSGWVQHAWFACADTSGRQHLITAHNVPVLRDEAITGVCLVGAVLQAGGGLTAARTQLVQRTLDLTWHTLYRGRGEPVHWCPAPSIRAAQVRDLTRWNDHPQRSAAEVTTLFSGARAVAATEAERCQAAVVA